jgi:hypothetical protein
VAVGADEYALLGLVAEGGDRPADCHGHRESLLLWVNVMERQVDNAPVVSANGTATSGLFDKYSLEFLLASCDRLTDASLTAPLKTALLPGAVLRELGQAMALAAALLDRPFSSGVGRTTSISDQRDWGREIPVDSPAAWHNANPSRIRRTKGLQIVRKVPPPGLEPGLRD